MATGGGDGKFGRPPLPFGGLTGGNGPPGTGTGAAVVAGG